MSLKQITSSYTLLWAATAEDRALEEQSEVRNQLVSTSTGMYTRVSTSTGMYTGVHMNTISISKCWGCIGLYMSIVPSCSSCVGVHVNPVQACSSCDLHVNRPVMLKLCWSPCEHSSKMLKLSLVLTWTHCHHAQTVLTSTWTQSHHTQTVSLCMNTTAASISMWTQSHHAQAVGLCVNTISLSSGCVVSVWTVNTISSAEAM